MVDHVLPINDIYVTGVQPVKAQIITFAQEQDSAINSEIGRAENAETGLQNQINAIASALHFAANGAVVAATTGALPACTYANGSSGIGATLTANANGALAAQDGIALVAANRVLVKNQAAALQNGVYLVTQVGDGSHPFILTRDGDADQAAELGGIVVQIAQGATLAGKAFLLPISVSGVNVGVTGLNFTPSNNVTPTGPTVWNAALLLTGQLGSGSGAMRPDAMLEANPNPSGANVAYPAGNGIINIANATFPPDGTSESSYVWTVYYTDGSKREAVSLSHKMVNLTPGSEYGVVRFSTNYNNGAGIPDLNDVYMRAFGKHGIHVFDTSGGAAGDARPSNDKQFNLHGNLVIDRYPNTSLGDDGTRDLNLIGYTDFIIRHERGATGNLAITEFVTGYIGLGGTQDWLVGEQRSDYTLSWYSFAAAKEVLLLGTDGTLTLNGNIVPMVNSTSVGTNSNPFNNIYSAHALNIVSDAQTKTGLREFSDKELDAWGRVGWHVYRNKREADEKTGVTAADREHFGLTAQAIEDAFKAESLDAYAYGFIGKEPLVETGSEEVDNGQIKRVPRMKEDTVKAKRVEIIDGKATLIEYDHTSKSPVEEMHPVFNPDGSPAMGKVKVFFDNPETGLTDYRWEDKQLIHHQQVFDEEPVIERQPFSRPVMEADGKTQVVRRFVRYTQCQAIEAAFQRRRADKLEARLAAMEGKKA
jgi:hypothetical protein